MESQVCSGSPPDAPVRCRVPFDSVPATDRGAGAAGTASLDIVVSGTSGVSPDELAWLCRLAGGGAVMSAVRLRGEIAVRDLRALDAVLPLAIIMPPGRPSLQEVNVSGVVHLDGEEDAIERLWRLERLVEAGASVHHLHLWRGKPLNEYPEEIRHGVELLGGKCHALVHLDSSRVFRELWRSGR
jgi:hypothetical protein